MRCRIRSRSASPPHQDHDLARVFTTFRASTPQVYANVDRVKAQKLGVSLASVFDTLQVYLGSLLRRPLCGRTSRGLALSLEADRDASRHGLP